MAIILGGQREKNRQKEGHSDGTYVYGKYWEYPPPPGNSLRCPTRLVCPSSNAITWVITVMNKRVWGYYDQYV